MKKKFIVLILSVLIFSGCMTTSSSGGTKDVYDPVKSGVTPQSEEEFEQMMGTDALYASMWDSYGGWNFKTTPGLTSMQLTDLQNNILVIDGDVPVTYLYKDLTLRVYGVNKAEIAKYSEIQFHNINGKKKMTVLFNEKMRFLYE